MTDLTTIKAGTVVKGYDTFTNPGFCSPTFFKCNVCLTPVVTSGKLGLKIAFNTPFGSYDKTFSITGDQSFTWNPIDRLSVTLTIKNFSQTGSAISFDVSATPCITIPFVGKKCLTVGHHFSVNTATGQNLIDEMDDQHFMNLMLIHSSINDTENCHCN